MNFKHGFTKINLRNSDNPEWRLHVAWLRMKSRCLEQKNKDYKNYGGRGITVSKEWLVFENFSRDMGLSPSKNHSIDRIDNNSGYSKENCKWSDRYEQGRNKRNNVYLVLNGERKTVSDWARHFNVPRRLYQVRLGRGWSDEKTLLTPQKAA